MTTRFRWMIAMAALLVVGALNVQGTIPDDADGDGVPDSVDVCPTEDASYFDRNGDGCIDDAIGPRHVEYWGWVDSVITYVINASGAPGIGGTADNDAIIAAFDSWTAIPGTGLTATYGGTVAQGVADGLDQVNLVTFVDNTYPFGLSTLAVGLSTSFESDTLIAGRVWRKGEIFDADMLFSPTKTFKVGGAGPGSDIRSTAAHEAGHLFGIAHTPTRSATMHYVLPGGFAARTLENDDQQVYYRAYATSASLSAASRLRGTVTNGQSSSPVPGALVFAIDASNPSDTAACVITMPDGSYDIAGLADGTYFVAIHPLDGTSSINYIGAGNVNDFTASIVDEDFLPEYYDAAESNMDDAADRTAVTVTSGATTTVDIITNIDGTPPEVVSITPASGGADVAIDGAYLVRFSERVDVGTIGASFSFKQGTTGIGGNIGVIKDDSVIVFTPSSPLDFSALHTLRIDTDLKDRAGNALATDYVATFTTEAEPPLSISSLAPNKGVPGTTLVINGRGFSVDPVPTVDFNGTPADVSSAAPGRLVVTVPDGVISGNVVVTNPDMQVSNSLVFTALSDAEIARGYESGTVNLSNTPNAIAVTPDGAYAYIASLGGVDAVVVDAAAGAYLTRELIADPAEYADIAIAPDGTRAYAVSPSTGKMIEIMTDPTTGLLFKTILSTRILNAQPRSIVVDPFGYRAYIATDAAEVQVWDIRLGSPSYREQVGVLPSPDGISLPGGMAITPDGSRLLALGASGEVFFYALGEDSLTDRVPVSLSPRAISVDPQGQRAYVTHDDGTISVVNVGGISTPPFFVQSISTGGLLRGLDTTPAGLYLYVTDRGADELKIVDLDETHTTFRSVIATAPMPTNPVDIVMSGDGVFAYSVLQGDGSAPRMVVTTIGDGPAIVSMVPQAGQPGTQIVITGTSLNDEGASATYVDFDGVIATPSRVLPDQIIVTVPMGVSSGPVTVRSERYSNPTQVSNAVYFEAIGPLYLDNGLRPAGTLEFPNNVTLFCDYLIKTLAFSPDGSYLYTLCGGGEFCFVFDIRPGSPTYNQMVGSFSVAAGTLGDIAVTADGKVAVITSDGQPFAYYCDPNDPRFGTAGPAFDFTTNMIAGGAEFVGTSPDNRSIMLIGGGAHMFVDATGLSDGVAPVVIDQNYPPALDDDIVFHPSGRAVFMLNPMSSGAVLIYNADPQSPNFGTISAVPTAPAPTSIDVSRDGKYVFAYSGNPSPNFEMYVTRINCENPDSCYFEANCVVGTGDASALSSDNTFRINPQGTFAIRTQLNTGFIEYDPTCPVEPFYRSLTSGVALDYGFTPDGRRIYAANAGGASLQMYDFLAAQKIVVASGNNQTGVTNALLPAPIRVLVQSSSSAPLDGVPVTFEAMNNGMLLTADGLKTKTIVATDAQGYAEIQWKLGDVGANTVLVSATALSGSPFNFDATANVDPSTLPLSLAEVVPLAGSTDVSPTTALLATFSRAIDTASISTGTLYLRDTATAATVAATYGFTDSNRKVSLTPSAALSLGTAYELVLSGAIQADAGGGGLTNPGSSAFTTLATVPLRLAAISPPSALVGVNVVLSGSGFDATPSANTVLFNGATATPSAGGPGSLVVRVPTGAIPGLVRVVAHGDTSNARSFTVLQPSTSHIDEVLATVPAGAGAKSCAVSPDGALIYAVSSDGDVIIPVDVEGLVSYPAIPVGDQPVAIVIHPDGRVAYVANFNSGSVSVIDTDPDSPTFNTVIHTIGVGRNPADLAVDPDGSRLVVANAGSSDVSIVDSDGSSTTNNAVLATVPSGAGAKSVAVSPDGTIYIGTNTGFTVLNAAYEVLTSVPSGSGSKSLAVSPDGTLLFVLTDDGDVLVVDIQDGSSSENEVLVTVPAGSGGKSLAVSADGTLLYLIPEIGDEVLVYEIEVIAGVSAIDPDAATPSFMVTATVIDTLTVGPDPSDVAIDPSGTGSLFVVNAGNSTISVFGPPAGPVVAEIRVTPRTLNLQSNGKYVTGRIELPATYFPQEIVVSSILLQGAVPAVPGTASFQDEDGDGLQELHVKFDRAAFQAVMPQGEFVPVTIEGDVRETTFAGEDTIRTIRPTVTHPHAVAPVAPGQSTYIAWTNPQGPSAPLVDVHFSADNGETWSPVALQVSNTGQVAWLAPDAFYEACRVLVTLWRDGEVYGQGMSQNPFMISAPVPTLLKTFDIALEDGAAVLRWETGVEVGMDGFAVVRSESELGVYREMTTEMIRAGGQATGGRYEFRDESVTANRTYWYKLQEVTSDGLGMEFGPYSVVYKLSYGLEANVPNPFNPTTTIKYALAQDGPVSLTVYDVRGARVRELVSERQRADVYKVVWDGSNDNGERVASGMYFYRLVAGKFTQTRKMMLLK